MKNTNFYDNFHSCSLNLAHTIARRAMIDVIKEQLISKFDEICTQARPYAALCPSGQFELPEGITAQFYHDYENDAFIILVDDYINKEHPGFSVLDYGALSTTFESQAMADLAATALDELLTDEDFDEQTLADSATLVHLAAQAIHKLHQQGEQLLLEGESSIEVFDSTSAAVEWKTPMTLNDQQSENDIMLEPVRFETTSTDIFTVIDELIDTVETRRIEFNKTVLPTTRFWSEMVNGDVIEWWFCKSTERHVAYITIYNYSKDESEIYPLVDFSSLLDTTDHPTRLCELIHNELPRDFKRPEGLTESRLD